VRAPTLLIVGGRDQPVLEVNRQARTRLGGPSALEVIGGASHLFDEPETLDRVAALAAAWFRHHLPTPARRARIAWPTIGRHRRTGPFPRRQGRPFPQALARWSATSPSTDVSCDIPGR
jgi:hypothetical protein